MTGQLRLKYFTVTFCYKQFDKYKIIYNKRIYSYIFLYIPHIFFLFVALFLSAKVCYDSRLKFNFIPMNKIGQQNKIKYNF